MNFKKIANENHEELARLSSRDFLGRMPPGIRRDKLDRNRAAKREAARRDLEERLADGE